MKGRVLSGYWQIGALAALLLGQGSAGAAETAEELLFCNRPEKVVMAGAHADRPLQAGKTYRIFFHYRNGTSGSGPLVVAFQGKPGQKVTVVTRKGIADPHRDPAHAGRQAMARFMQAPEARYQGADRVRFPIPLDPWQVASGVMWVRLEGGDARLRIYYKHDRYVVPGVNVVSIPSPRRDYEVVLTPEAKRRYFRIGIPEPKMHKQLDGTYGVVYAFKVTAPPGSKVRVAFSPRGGQSGLVGTVDGVLKQSQIVAASAWTVFSDLVVGKEGLTLLTMPFGGVFYPVELAFDLR